MAYMEYGQGEAAEQSAPVTQLANNEQKLSLERDMQLSLRQDLAGLEAGLTIADNGVEHQVATGRIDLLARDRAGALVVIELKAGRADDRALTQLLGYMADLRETHQGAAVRGYLVAHDFTERTRSAASMIPSIQLKRYRVTFAFMNVE